MSLNAKQVLNEALESLRTKKVEASLLSDDMKRIKQITSRACNNQNIAVLSVLITLIVKKVVTPKQDIRLHQANMDGGFSGRGLDEKTVTPFLRENSFPYMISGSGWLTRSLEQPHPY